MSRNAIIFRDLTFNMAHRLSRDDGPCKNVHGHEVLVKTEILGCVQTAGSEAGMVMPFAQLKTALNKVHDLFDHNLVLRYGDPLIEDLTNKELINNAGWADMCGTMVANINANGYHDTRCFAHNPHRQEQHMLIIAEEPTSENIAYLIHRLLSLDLYAYKPAQMKVTFQETRKCGAAFAGEVRERPDFPQLPVSQ